MGEAEAERQKPPAVAVWSDDPWRGNRALGIAILLMILASGVAAIVGFTNERAPPGAENDVQDLTKIEGGGDLGGDLLDDAHVVRALREIAIEAVDRFLVAGELVAEAGGVRAHPPAGGTCPAVTGRLVRSATARSARRSSS